MKTPTTTPRTRRDRPREETPAARPTTPRAQPAPECNVAGCDGEPEWRGLCSAHRQTHRGLAGPKDPKPGEARSDRTD